MFTGLIQDVGMISRISPKGGKKEISVLTQKMQNQLKTGDSIACNGICLTVIAFDSHQITVEAMNETIHKTTLGNWSLRQAIHLERAMQLSDRLDGHIVQGHVDCVSSLISKKTIHDTLYLEFYLDNQYKNLIVAQGSIAINGVSLTVSAKKTDSFEVSLISHTLENTHFGILKTRDQVNLEFDIIGKYVMNMFSKSKVNEKWLQDLGF